MKKKKSIFSCDLHHSSKKALCLHKQEKIEDKNDDVEIVDIVEHNDINIIDFVKGMNQKKSQIKVCEAKFQTVCDYNQHERNIRNEMD